jgi:nitroreductase
MTMNDVDREPAMTVTDAIARRRAVRAYAPDRLDEATVRALLDAAIHAPTAMHEEPWRFVVIQDPEALRRYSDRAKSMASAEAARQRDLLRVPGGPIAPSHLDLLLNPGFNIFYNASTLIVICGETRDPFTPADCWLAAENLMLAATARGLGTCTVGFAIGMLNDIEVKEELGIPPDVTAVAPIIVGVPAATTPKVSRKAPVVLRWVKAGAKPA